MTESGNDFNEEAWLGAGLRHLVIRHGHIVLAAETASMIDEQNNVLFSLPYQDITKVQVQTGLLAFYTHHGNYRVAFYDLGAATKDVAVAALATDFVGNRGGTATGSMVDAMQLAASASEVTERAAAVLSEHGVNVIKDSSGQESNSVGNVSDIKTYPMVRIYERLLVPVLAILFIALALFALALFPVGLIISGIALLGLWWLVLVPARCPTRMAIHGATLSTYGWRGNKSVQLDKLTSVELVYILWNKSNFMISDWSIYGLRLTDQNGHAVIIHLGSIPRSSRRPVYEAVAPYINNPQVSKPANFANLTINKWLLFTQPVNQSK